MANIGDAKFQGQDGGPRRRESSVRGGQISIPADPHFEGNAIEVRALRSSISDAGMLMHNLSLAPSMRDRRASRNSFGVSLPIPRSPRASRLSSDLAKEKVEAAKNMAFAFDIDGVLVHGSRLIPEAARVMELLNGDNELGIKIPYILLTNGGGKTESARVEELSRILGSPISTDQFIQSHTPMQALSEYYETVLVAGGDGYKIRQVAEDYGFKNVVLPKDILAWDPTISPWSKLSEEERKQAKIQDFDKMNFEAIMVFADSRDYATDMQIIMDLLLSENGRLKTKSKTPLENQLPIYFSQGDLLMPTEHGVPRLTQGLFRISIEAMYKSLTGGDLERVVYGKPELATYKFADEVMKQWMKEIHNEHVLPKNIYMVGDNPQSDIVGGNMYGWNTCLVRTGIFQGGENDEENPASFGVFANVLDAVQAAIKKELGKEFKFRWSDKINPVLHPEGAWGTKCPSLFHGESSAMAADPEPTRHIYLPPEILCTIFSYIEDQSQANATLRSCCLVCRQWCSVATPFLYREPSIKSGNFAAFAAAVISPINQPHSQRSDLGQYVRTLDLSELVHHSTNSMTAKLLRAVRQGLELFIAPGRSISSLNLLSISKCQNLQILDLSLVLTELSFGDVKNATKNLTSLTTLRLPKNTSLSLAANDVPWPPNLTVFQFGGDDPADIPRFAEEFSWPEKLTSLTLHNCKSLTIAAGQAIFGNPQLQQRLRRLRITSDNNFTHFRFMADLVNVIPKVKWLSLPGGDVNSTIIPTLATLNTQLELEVLRMEPSLVSWVFPLNEFKRALGSSLPRLRHLRVHVVHVPSVSYDSVVEEITLALRKNAEGAGYDKAMLGEVFSIYP
ncbi:conserved hypothetical protein [Uncinocarpus reesii 1704]|uniref:F-box domain-containing protein n=1 Tax=Uncinocarpus reesii (strain UAMH 1704) TaxID=336963 RepID=C4JSR5_UNCRE|nr:uncharacterized protein UREG_05504 [Uncinocarpus reesii 1704]EEP80662.1 conserved hypothetical protein [Uncinocarpus reesii 1704]